MAEAASDDEIIRKGDELYDASEWQPLFDLFYPHRESSNPDVLWRVTRAIECVTSPKMKKAEKKKLHYEAYECAKKALDMAPDNWGCHQQYGITLLVIGEYEGSKAQILNLNTAKEHFLKSIELNPKDALSHHLIGQWCFEIANMSWVERKLASTLFATPPTSSFEEALEHFNLAEQKDPGFYCENQTMLGKTHLKMGNKDEAKKWCTKALELKILHPDDEKAQDEARKVLRSL
ncbi:regulator of microtubule dynamics protein 1-like [Corticium candelabrum]|uniref:regulator of microtubule dynamics protein 1-like n=1 Tax=Corticium candelabrum TaxID=121492 RepID=UPI002E271527|nr:regulator of microtubule dynamics protein 1-like [Corticium candelabrum]